MKIGEFFVQLGIKADTPTVREFTRAIGDLPLEIAGALTALAGLEYSFVKIASQAMDTAVGLRLFTSETGLSAQELQKWQSIAEQMGISTDSISSSIANLQRQMAEIRLGRGNIAPFQMLGIGVNQSAFAVLLELRERIKGIDRATAVNLISQMGLTPEMIQILQLSNREFDKLIKTTRIMTGEQVRDFTKVKQVLNQYGQTIRSLVYGVLDELAKIFLGINGELENFVNLLPLIISSVLILGAAFAPVTMAVVGLLLALEDIAGYFSGKDSITGRAIAGIKSLGTDVTKPSSINALLDKTLKSPLSPLNAVASLFSLPAAAVVGGPKALGGVFNFYINGTANPSEVAKMVTDQLGKIFGETSAQLDNAGPK